jgi:hypothetical protein
MILCDSFFVTGILIQMYILALPNLVGRHMWGLLFALLRGNCCNRIHLREEAQ